MISGKVDYLRKNTIAGWVNSTGQERAEVRITIRGERHVTRADIERKGTKTPANIFGFRLVLPEDFTTAALFDGTLIVEAKQEGDSAAGHLGPLGNRRQARCLGSDHAATRAGFPGTWPPGAAGAGPCDEKDLAPAEPVTALLKPADFDEEFYLETHKDVRTAVVRGTVQSGFHHYTLYGRAEGRQLMLARLPKP
ncbi:hypothetical protein ACFQY5_40795 [Paeniroseomonas aquatica]|uniref:hypothetical protein n=1 Tax=Paeniroseomonas aquatica TaxID=373043 RepID=UPI00361AFB6D